MPIKIKTYLTLFYYSFIIINLSVLNFKVNAETKIIAKKGDTLLTISRRYGVPLKVLMYKNNFKDATKTIEGEAILIPLEDNKNKINKHNLTHKVVKGETLYKIARDYNVKVEDIISLNNLSNDLYLSINQIIILPEEATKNKNTNIGNVQLARKKVFYHLTSKIENLSNIAKLHRIRIEEINNLNKLNYPVKINPNTQIRLRENKFSKWRKYGPIMVSWSDWTYFDGNYFSNAKTKKNTSFFIAINCKTRTLNNTSYKTSWSNWYFPKTDFEFKLINDFCDQEFNF